MSPLAAPHPCREPRCPELLPMGVDRCQMHTRARAARRGSSTQQGYTSKWERESKTYLAIHRICVIVACGARSTVVDHIIPHRGDQTLFWSRRNWQAMCGPHHSRKTALEDGGFGRPRLTRGRAVEISRAEAGPSIAQQNTRGRRF